MTEPEALARKLARAQCTEVAIVSALRLRCGMTEGEAEALVKIMATELGHEVLDACCEVHERLYEMTRDGASNRGLMAVLEWGRQFCGWSRDGIGVELRKRLDEANKRRYGGKLRAA